MVIKMDHTEMVIKTECIEYDEIEHEPLILDSHEEYMTVSETLEPTEHVLSELETVYFAESHGDQEEIFPESLLGFVESLDLIELESAALAIEEINSAEKKKPVETVHDFVHKCDYCVSRFSTLAPLREHLKRHANVKCESCSEVFHNTYERDCHSRIAHTAKSSDNSLGVYQFCKCCHLGFATMNNVISHLQRCHIEFINQELQNKHSTEVALDTTTSNKHKYICHKCTVLVMGAANIKAHILHHRASDGKNKIYQCRECPASFGNVVQINEHLIFHAFEAANPANDDFRCIYCYQTLKNFTNLRVHIMGRHNGKDLHHCKYCNTCHFRTTLLAKHKREIHGVSPFWRCKGCDKLFIRPTHHMRHSNKCLGGRLTEKALAILGENIVENNIQ